MLEIILDIVLLVLPAALSLILARFIKTKEEEEKFLRILKLAEEAVLFAEDAFPNLPGVEKLKKAVEYLKGVLAKAGVKLTDRELEAKVRAAYQRLQGEALERILERLAVKCQGQIAPPRDFLRSLGLKISPHPFDIPRESGTMELPRALGSSPKGMRKPSIARSPSQGGKRHDCPTTGTVLPKLCHADGEAGRFRYQCRRQSKPRVLPLLLPKRCVHRTGHNGGANDRQVC